ncbi:MAG: hypothetical protein PHW35_05505 [Lentimicrobiaceae bacterium]|nr:hypothetical protein [Lentimicrobiaceae bacterium]MDD4597403.1 hypothetical protein [Lentimicrobiaceae bacterium]MDY0025934.1 hypothetical protein [Lentimicrobium sp.]HAH59874.1 hypothetical protein [Bacteroidales bacterium]
MYVWEGYMSNEDALLCDFDLDIGDTLHSTLIYMPYDDFIVANIDGILVGDSYRKIFHFQADYNNYPEEVLIEGIGFGGGNDTTYYPEYGVPCELNVSVTQISADAEFKP